MAVNKSPKEKSAIRSAAGKMAAIWLAIEAAVRKLGGNDDAILQLDSEEAQPLIEQIAQLLVGKAIEPIVQVAWKLVFNWVIAVCRFTSYVDPNITAENFPFLVGALDLKEVIAVAITKDMSTREVLEFLDREGFRPATLFELLFWWLTHPAEQTDCLVVALGSVWRGRAPYVHGGRGARRGLSLDAVGRGWGRRCRFAAVRKSAVPAA